MTRRDYVLLTELMAGGLAMLAKQNEKEHPDAKDGESIGPSEMMQGFILGMGVLAAGLHKDNARFDPALFFDNVSKQASEIAGSNVSVKLEAIIETETDDETPSVEVIAAKKEDLAPLFSKHPFGRRKNGGTIH